MKHPGKTSALRPVCVWNTPNTDEYFLSREKERTWELGESQIHSRQQEEKITHTLYSHLQTNYKKKKKKE